ncbi:MAG: ion channel [Chitinophagaceae bacterium]|nr:ion channel [Chitinophagaceae bacterium]
MAGFRSLNPFARANNDTGFGNNSTVHGGRFVNRDGTFNIRREGGGRWRWFSMYYTMLNVPTWQFLLIVFCFFLAMNLLFTLIYLAIGFDSFMGYVPTDAWGKAKELFYFSLHTFTTVGYGRVNPMGDLASFVAGVEAMSGFLSFAWATGMLYGRFVRPRANLQFTRRAVVAPYQGITGLMFRFVALKEKHTLTNVEVKVSLAMKMPEAQGGQYQFFDLPLERSQIDSLPMNFTVVHPINEQSPLWGLQADDYAAADVEIYVLVRAFDDVYSANVQQRTSYTYQEVDHGRRFVPMFHESEDGMTTILEMDKLDQQKEAPLL